jgi:hypothetical protein
MTSTRRILIAGLAHAFGALSKTLTGQTLEERANRHVRRVYPKDIAQLEAAQAKRARKNAKRLGK